MKIIGIPRAVALASIFLSPAALAQDPDTEAVVPADDGPITILDQVVPVADEDPPADGPPEEGSSEEGPPGKGQPEEGPSFEQINAHELLLAEFERFKELKAVGALDEAGNVAKRMVELSIRSTGPTSNDTAKALTNLAVIQHETEDYEAAQQNFAAAVEIIEDNEDRLNAELINPLRGLGASQLESGRPDLAVRTFGRAVHISHVNEGPHNLGQISILESLAETNLRLGSMEEAKNNQDMIYALNLRYYDGNSEEMVPSLLRRASWQHRTGYILDERATYRRVIRIIESESSKNDIALIAPLMKLGETYFFPDTSDTHSFQSATMASGEMYFKRAVRIAEQNPEPDWVILAKTKLALGDYYNFRSDQSRALRAYRDTWELMSAEEDRLDTRRLTLEVLTALNTNRMPRYAGDASASDRRLDENSLYEGRIIVSYDVTARGRVSGLKIVEATPVEFEDMRRYVRREMRTRIYRPRFEDAEPVASPNQAFTHTFYYRQEDLDKLREENDADSDPAEEPGQQADSG